MISLLVQGLFLMSEARGRLEPTPRKIEIRQSVQK